MTKRRRHVTPPDAAPVTPPVDAAPDAPVVTTDAPVTDAPPTDAPPTVITVDTPPDPAADVPALTDAWTPIRAAGNAIRALPMASTDAIRAAVTVATDAADAVRRGAIGAAGRYTGMRVYDFQNRLFDMNDRPDFRFTDRALCALWRVEFPGARCDYPAHPDYVASTRTAYNGGRHGTTGAGHHACRAYDVNGTPIGRVS